MNIASLCIRTKGEAEIHIFAEENIASHVDGQHMRTRGERLAELSLIDSGKAVGNG